MPERSITDNLVLHLVVSETRLISLFYLLFLIEILDSEGIRL
jgi:hypothetical protein